jgi:hypothetical protein
MKRKIIGAPVRVENEEEDNRRPCEGGKWRGG